MGEVVTAARPPAYLAAETDVPLVEGTVGDVLRRAAARFPDRKAVAWAEGVEMHAITYAELLAEAERVANWLLTRGAAGDRVAIWSRNTLEWVLAEHGCALAGMVVASWNPGWTDYECEHARDLTTPVVVLAGQDTRGVSLLERAKRIGGERTVALDDLRGLAASAPIPTDYPKPAPSDLFLLQFTSGTTGRAKGAALSHRAALNAAWLRFHTIGADETDVWVNPSPLNHMGGAITMVLGIAVTGACYVIMNRFDAGEYLRLIRVCGGTRIGGVPTVLLSLVEHPDWVPGSITLRSIGAGGAQVPQPLIERLSRDFGAPVLISFAQSECPMITSSVPGDSPRLLSETVGRPVAHVEVKIVDPSGRTVGLDETGEICARGPVAMDGYYRMPEATAATIDPDGFLHTGDLGALDGAGYLRIQGRARDVIIRGGENIYPAEVEDAILAHPAVGQVAVVGVPDERWGQIVGAAVLLRPGETVSVEALEAHVATRIAHFKTPRRWLFVDGFPLTPSNKIRKVEVEKMFAPAPGGAEAKR